MTTSNFHIKSAIKASFEKFSIKSFIESSIKSPIIRHLKPLTKPVIKSHMKHSTKLPLSSLSSRLSFCHCVYQSVNQPDIDIFIDDLYNEILYKKPIEKFNERLDGRFSLGA